MSRNVEVSIRIEMRPTCSPPTGPWAKAKRGGPGQFHVVLEGDKWLDIDALEDGLFRSAYPALQEALATHLEREMKGRSNDAASVAIPRLHQQAGSPN